ncbi:MAG: HlyD family secretion protein [Candidatus Kapaibacterium sp.]
MNKYLIILLAFAAIAGCSSDNAKSDAYGNFEAEETTISAETQGRILAFLINEGDNPAPGDTIAIIDTTQLVLQRRQLEASRRTAETRFPGITAQVDVLDQQLRVARKNLERVERMLQDDAATQKQFDDLSGEIDVIQKRIASIKTQNSTIFAEIDAIDAQIAKLDDMIARSYIINPVRGTVLNTFAEAAEIAAPGKPLYKIARLDTLDLRVYVSGAQLPDVKIGQQAEVIFDKSKTENHTATGRVSWIASEAEFTPKIIQTKEERVNLVYAVKLRVPNPEGSIKIGMPGEANFK